MRIVFTRFIDFKTKTIFLFIENLIILKILQFNP